MRAKGLIVVAIPLIALVAITSTSLALQHSEQVLNELKADSATAGIPVVILSADATPGVIRRLRAGGALAYLTKPLDLAELGKLLDSFAAPASDRQDATRIADRQS